VRTLVTCFSQTGNTRKVADAIFGEVTGPKELKELSELEDLAGYDLIFFGLPIHAGGPAAPAREFLEKNAVGRQMALFVTHAAPEGMDDVAAMIEACRQAASGAALLGVFDCRGELAQPVADFLLKSDDPRHQEFGRRAGETRGQPDEECLNRARQFAREIIGQLA
jgi:flavodoxin